MFKKLPPLKSLLAFSAASRSNNFSIAAKELFITQSAVSHQIKNLEQFLGCKLFYRDGKQLKLTEEGTLLSSTVNQGFDQIISVVEQLTGQMKAALQFGVISTFAIHRVTPELPALIERHPKLDLRLRMISCGDPVTSLNLDMFINDQPIEHVSYECEKLKIETYHVVASPEVAKTLRNCPPKDWSQKAKFIDIQDVDVWDSWCERHEVAIESRDTQYFSHTILMLQAALSGQGLVLLGESLIQKELASGQLVKVSELPISFDDDGFYFIWHKRRKNDPNIRLVKNWLYGLLKTY